MTVLTASATVPAESPWWPELALAPAPVLPPDPDADLLPVRDEPDEWAELSVYDLIDDADRAEGKVCADPAVIVARVAEGADVHGEPVGLVAAVTVLAGIDPQLLDGAARVDLIRSWERVLAMVAGEQQRALASVAEATASVGLPGIEARHEVAACAASRAGHRGGAHRGRAGVDRAAR